MREPATRIIGVVGAGTMGHGIAHVAARAGFEVVLTDVSEDLVTKGLETIDREMRRAVEKGRMSADEKAQAFARIRGGAGTAPLARTDLVVEAIVEKEEAKLALFAELDRACGPATILASNTSSISLTRIAAATRRPERVVGMHFFNPVTRMPLVEVIRTATTDAAALETVLALTRRLGKTPVLVRDAPGFLVNRILMPYLAEAVGFVERGEPVGVVDRELRTFGMPLGPLELLDEIGLDVARKVAHVLGDAFGARMPSVALIDKLAAEGALGKKSGLGFYRYERGRRGSVNPALGVTSSERPSTPTSEITDRVVDAMINEAALALDDSVVDDPNDVDLAMILGTGFPPFRGGLLRHADAVGVGTIVERLTRRQQSGAPYGPCGRLQRMALGGERFHR